jgi:hypothetical protein
MYFGRKFTEKIDDNTKPPARVGRKAYRVSQRQPGCRNITMIFGPGFFAFTDPLPLFLPGVGSR